MRMRKVYGQSRQERCYFCDKTALSENSQGLPACKDHKDKVLEDKKCACGEYLDIKKSKWGAFFLCSHCGPISLKKSEEMEDLMKKGTFNINKRYREKVPLKYDHGRIYTIDELEKMWEDK